MCSSATGPAPVVEVVSRRRARFDRVVKLAYYAERGVPEYWIVSPREHTVERVVLSPDGHYVIAQAAGEGDVLRPESFPGLELPLAEPWKRP